MNHLIICHLHNNHSSCNTVVVNKHAPWLQKNNPSFHGPIVFDYPYDIVHEKLVKKLA